MMKVSWYRLNEIRDREKNQDETPSYTTGFITHQSQNVKV